jgi:hypothetical protein
MKKELPMLSKLMVETLSATLPYLPDATRTGTIVRCIAQVYLSFHGSKSPWGVLGMSVKEIEGMVEGVTITIEENEKVGKRDDVDKGGWTAKDNGEALDNAIRLLTYAHRDLSGAINMLNQLSIGVKTLPSVQEGIRERLEFLRMLLRDKKVRA